ncbi:metallophosphoesterase [Mechercharimyces sp. CAU 1602]|uniref:metallophosphoesterase n=1 Tax=Mechercharimyces sp. CAU 1602 TaxID=2973933 RepID=UPI0021631D67|nr:metallophosphoesterase [Mechercharimyces sp. CAU 1602]MCS1350457.1 metallophosphoesterase [Mechercharimyces sp. CAU 1602]
MENKIKPTISRRQFLKKGGRWGIGAAIGMGSLSSYGLWLEPHWVEWIKITISLPRLPGAFVGKKLLHFSDLHFGTTVKEKQLAQLVADINEEKPDLVCFTGDLYDKRSAMAATGRAVSAELDRIDAPLGKYSILGNHDYSDGLPAVGVLEEAGFEVLLNRHVKVTHKEKDLYMVGLEDLMLGDPQLLQALAGIPAGACSILLMHEPDFIDAVDATQVDLQLSGHSHGGQIRLPLVGPLLTPPYGGKYPEGLARGEKSGVQVYTSRGVGTTILPVRLFCRPQVTVITLQQ